MKSAVKRFINRGNRRGQGRCCYSVKPPRSNLSREERRVRIGDTSKINLPADKGNAVVIMETEIYKGIVKKDDRRRSLSEILQSVGE